MKFWQALGATVCGFLLAVFLAGAIHYSKRIPPREQRIYEVWKKATGNTNLTFSEWKELCDFDRSLIPHH